MAHVVAAACALSSSQVHHYDIGYYAFPFIIYFSDAAAL